jgi:hypothetical protein
MDDEPAASALSVQGSVVEILERGSERVARIVLEPGTVVEVSSPPADVTLGDRVVVDASLRIERVREREHADDGGDARQRTDDAGATTPLRFGDYEHTLRVAVVFLLGVAAFLGWRSWMVPGDFGVYGHFRAGAIGEIAARTPRFAGQAACVECHDEVQQARLAGRHKAIGCESCHGPLGQHARGETDVAPVRPNGRATCLVCHVSRPGLPSTFPRVVVKEHSEAGPCTECHKPHAPGLT